MQSQKKKYTKKNTHTHKHKHPVQKKVANCNGVKLIHTIILCLYTFVCMYIHDKVYR